MEMAYVGVGSNVEPEKNILSALRLLVPEGLKRVSMVYRTEPVGPKGQPFFYNCVVEVETGRPPAELKYSVLRKIEEVLGRKRNGDKYSKRPIDLDLIMYNSLELKTEDIVLPDPDIYTRPFLALPLLELAPGMTLPDNRSLQEVAESLDKSGMEELAGFTAMVKGELFG